MNIIPKLTEKQLARFWSKVLVGGVDECWAWRGSCNLQGYGRFWIADRCYLPSRVALAIAGKRSNILLALHTCNNTSCVNPNHLYFGTQQQNCGDREAAGNAHNMGGSKQWKSKLTETDIPLILELTSFATQAEIAALMGVAPATISHVLAGRTWNHVSGIKP